MRCRTPRFLSQMTAFFAVQSPRICIFPRTFFVEIRIFSTPTLDICAETARIADFLAKTLKKRLSKCFTFSGVAKNALLPSSSTRSAAPMHIRTVNHPARYHIIYRCGTETYLRDDTQTHRHLRGLREGDRTRCSIDPARLSPLVLPGPLHHRPSSRRLPHFWQRSEDNKSRFCAP